MMLTVVTAHNTSMGMIPTRKSFITFQNVSNIISEENPFSPKKLPVFAVPTKLKDNKNNSNNTARTGVTARGDTDGFTGKQTLVYCRGGVKTCFPKQLTRLYSKLIDLI